MLDIVSPLGGDVEEICRFQWVKIRSHGILCFGITAWGRCWESWRFSMRENILRWTKFTLHHFQKEIKNSTLARLIMTHLYVYKLSNTFMMRNNPENLFLILAFGIEGWSNSFTRAYFLRIWTYILRNLNVYFLLWKRKQKKTYLQWYESNVGRSGETGSLLESPTAMTTCRELVTRCYSPPR